MTSPRSLGHSGCTICRVGLFVQESGPIGAPAVVFLHGGFVSGRSWTPVVGRLNGRYRCIVPDLPQYGKSADQSPFKIARAAEAVAKVIRSQSRFGRAHLVGFSLGAQVGVELMATKPELVDRAVMCGTAVNTLLGTRLTQFIVTRMVRTRGFERWISRHWQTRQMNPSSVRTDDYREDYHQMTGEALGRIVAESVSFTIPDGLDKSKIPALFIAGSKELPLVRSWAALLARPMRQGASGVVAGMHHDWPLSHPNLFARVIDGWLSDTALPPQLHLLSSDSR